MLPLTATMRMVGVLVGAAIAGDGRGPALAGAARRTPTCTNAAVTCVTGTAR